MHLWAAPKKKRGDNVSKIHSKMLQHDELLAKADSKVYPHLPKHIISHLKRMLDRSVWRDYLQQLVVVHNDQGVDRLLQRCDSLQPSHQRARKKTIEAQRAHENQCTSTRVAYVAH